MFEASEFPLDVRSLHKGQTLSQQWLLENGVVSGKPGSAEWAFDLLRVRDFIVQRSVELGEPLSCRVYRNGLRIHTDSEASEYHDKRARHAQRGIYRQTEMLKKLVDVTKLSHLEQQKHTRSLTVWGAKAAMLKKTPLNIEHHQEESNQ